MTELAISGKSAWLRAAMENGGISGAIHSEIPAMTFDSAEMPKLLKFVSSGEQIGFWTKSVDQDGITMFFARIPKHINLPPPLEDREMIAHDMTSLSKYLSSKDTTCFVVTGVDPEFSRIRVEGIPNDILSLPPEIFLIQIPLPGDPDDDDESNILKKIRKFGNVSAQQNDYVASSGVVSDDTQSLATGTN